MFKVVIGHSATMHGAPVGKEMGINTWAAFAGTMMKRWSMAISR